MAMMHVCIECGKTFWGGNAAKRCLDCRRRRYLPGSYNLKSEMGKEKVCICCGEKYNVPESGSENCPKCIGKKMKAALVKLCDKVETPELPLVIQLPDELFNPFMLAAAENPDQIAFIFDWSTSLLWGNTSETDDIPESRIIQLNNIWCAAHMAFNEIRMAVNLTQEQFSKRYCIPKRSIENWEKETKTCTLALKLLLEKEVGVLVRKYDWGI